MKPRLVILAALAATSLFALATGSITKLPDAWGLDGKNPSRYEIGLDSSVTVTGKGSKFIRSVDSSVDDWGTLMQSVSAKNYVGHRVRFEAKVKTSGVRSAGLWMRVDGAERKLLGFYNSQDKPIQGSTDWQVHSVVLDVPQDSVGIAFGVLQYGKGQVWIDDLRMEIVGNDVPVSAPANGMRKLQASPSL